MDELRSENVPSAAYPGELLADVIPAEVITTLAIIEQTDDEDFLEKGKDAFDEVLSQYGLKREEAYRYSVSSAKALGPCSSPTDTATALIRWSCAGVAARS